MKNRSKPVTFRLSGVQWERLAREAETRGTSVGDLARRFVVQALEEYPGKRMEEEVAQLATNIRQLRTVIGKATLALLVDAGKCSEPAARQWVSEELL